MAGRSNAARSERPLAQSKLTAQGQISVPVEVRKRLAIGPGSVIEWKEEGGKLVVRRAAKLSSQDLHRAVFPGGPPRRKRDDDLERGIRAHIRKKYASR